MNKAMISGRVKEFTNVDNDVGLFAIKELQEGSIFYVYYEKHLFKDLEVKLPNKNIFIMGRLEYIRVRLPSHQLTRRLLAIKLEEIETISDEI